MFFASYAHKTFIIYMYFCILLVMITSNDVVDLSKTDLHFISICICVGTFPVVALMVGNAVTRLTSANDFCNLNGTESTNSSSDPCYLNQCETFRVDIAVTLSFLVGILMVRIVLSIHLHLSLPLSFILPDLCQAINVVLHT